MVVKSLGTVNLLQPRLELKYIGLLILVVVILLAAWAIGQWIFGTIKGIAKPVTGKAESVI